MKILLLNPPGEFCRAGSRWPHIREKTWIEYNPFPFWLAYATAVLLESGYEADIRDCIALGWDIPKLLSYVDKHNPDLIVMETSTPSYDYDLELKKCFEQPTLAVGAHATATPECHLHDNYNYVAIGEYELSVLELVEYLDGKIDKMPESIASKERPDAKHHALIEDLDMLPWPPWHLMPMERYSDPFCWGRNFVVMTSRGCPNNCSFCTGSVFYGRPNYRTRKAGAVCDEIEYAMSKYRPDEFYFDDDSFTVSKKHAIGICQEMKKRGLNIRWSCMGDAKVNPEVLEAMADAGCRAMKFGVESADPEVLKGIPKHVDLEDIKGTVQKCREVGIKAHATYMFGLPGETPEKAQKTIDFALRLGTDTAQFSTATPFLGTRFHEMAEKNGWLVVRDWRYFNGAGSAVVEYPNYSRDQIIEMQQMARLKWNRYMVMKKPHTVMHHLYSIYRRRGCWVTLQAIPWACKKIITGS